MCRRSIKPAPPARNMAWGSSANLRHEIVAQLLVETVGVERARELAPININPDHPPVVEEAGSDSALEPPAEPTPAELGAVARLDATLLGLLGTIIGLIAAFTAVANADPAEKATLLSQSISIAMNTTAFGLMVAIPLLLVHSLLQSKTSAIVESLEIAVVKFLNLMEGEAAPARAAAAAPRKAAPAKA